MVIAIATQPFTAATQPIAAATQHFARATQWHVLSQFHNNDSLPVALTQRKFPRKAKPAQFRIVSFIFDFAGITPW